MLLFLGMGCAPTTPLKFNDEDIFEKAKLGMSQSEVEKLLGPPRIRAGDQVYYGTVPQREAFESPQAPRSVVLEYDTNSVLKTKTIYFRKDGQPRRRRESLDSFAEPK